MEKETCGCSAVGLLVVSAQCLFDNGGGFFAVIVRHCREQMVTNMGGSDTKSDEVKKFSSNPQKHRPITPILIVHRSDSTLVPRPLAIIHVLELVVGVVCSCDEDKPVVCYKTGSNELTESLPPAESLSKAVDSLTCGKHSKV